MIRRPPRSTRTDTLFPYTTLFRSLWNDWGWRVPFLLSLLLLAISLWMRFKLAESPVFQAMKQEGEIAGNPFIESFTYPGNKKRIFIALFGIAAGLTVIWYTAMVSGLRSEERRVGKECVRTCR